MLKRVILSAVLAAAFTAFVQPETASTGAEPLPKVTATATAGANGLHPDTRQPVRVVLPMVVAGG